jgi:hypothetical protein
MPHWILYPETGDALLSLHEAEPSLEDVDRMLAELAPHLERNEVKRVTLETRGHRGHAMQALTATLQIHAKDYGLTLDIRERGGNLS